MDRSSLEAESRPRSAPARRESDHDIVVWLLAVITVILTAAALKASAPVTMPLAFAYFLAVLVYPLQSGSATTWRPGCAGSPCRLPCWRWWLSWPSLSACSPSPCSSR